MKKLLLIVLVMSFTLIPCVFADLEIVKPEIGTIVSIDDVEVQWRSYDGYNHAYVTVKDLTANELLVDKEESKYGSRYTVHHNYLVDGHTYEVIVNIEKDNGTETISTIFKVVNSNVVIEPLIKNPDEWETPQKDLTFGWQADYSADYYIVNIVNLTSGEVLVADVKLDEDDNEYKLKGSLLKPIHEYRFEVTTVKNGSKKTDQTVFYVTDKDLEQPDIIQPKDGSLYHLYNIVCVWNPIETADYYLVKVDDLTSGLKSIVNVEVDENGYTIDQELLKEGHEYKINFAAVVGDEEKWNSSIFKIMPPTLESPSLSNLDRNEIVPYDELSLRWDSTQFIDYYKVEVMDTDENVLVLNSKYEKARCTVEKSLLKPGHHYEVTVTTVRDESDRVRTVPFSVEPVDLNELMLKNPKLEYHHELVIFEWDDLDGIDEYKISIQNLDSKEIILEDLKTMYSAYQLPIDLLESGTRYRFVLSCESLGEKATVTHDFNTRGIISSWAKPFIDSVHINKVMKEDLFTSLVSNPQADLTRVEFCEMLVALYETSDNPNVIFDIDNAKTFMDIQMLSDERQEIVLKANALGIISGTSENTFTPYGLVTREEMAVMLKNTHHAIKGVYQHHEKNHHTYKDHHNISVWAVESVEFSSDLGILEGDGESFKPKDHATHEMGFVLLDKMFKKIND
mgnify:CR=1 FL=1